MIAKISPGDTTLESLRDSLLLDDLRTAETVEEKTNLLLNYLRTYDAMTADSAHLKTSIVNKVLGTNKWDVANRDHAKCLLYLSFYVPNDSDRSQLQDLTLDRLLDTPFEDGYDLLFSEEVQKNLRSISPVLTFVENRALLHEHFDKLKKKMATVLEFNEKVPDLNNLIVFEAVMEYLASSRNIVKVLKASLECQEDDTELKRLLYSSELVRMKGVDNVVQTLYRSNVYHRHALLRNLLTSRNGLLQNQVGRTHLHQMMIEQVLQEPETPDDRTWHRYISGLSKKFIVNADLENVYFVLVPFLNDRILNPPLNPASLDEVIFDYHTAVDGYAIESEEEKELHIRRLRGEDVMDDIRTLFIGKHKPECPDEETLDKEVEKEVTDFINVNDTIKQDIKEELTDEYKDGLPVETLEDKMRLHTIIGDPIQRSKGRLSALRFTVTAAKNLGAPGVKFLQMLGQYVAVPDRYQQEFNQVYDEVKGQSKLAAYVLLEREWKGFKDDVLELRPSVGGGSLMTVYEALTKDGEREVVKVLNPNAEFQTERYFTVMRDVIERQIEEDASFRIALPILEDIREWIMRDINFENFLEKDLLFYRQNNGYSVYGLPYSIQVPKSRGQENRYYKREEYIDGLNLTQIHELQRRGHDLKSITALMTMNHLNQIMNGYIHSDVHPGNFRVTDDRRVAILDRNYFLELDDQDKILLWALRQPSEPAVKVAALESYTSAYNKRNVKFGSGIHEAFAGDGGVRQLGNIIRYVRKANINVPLKMSLVVKNLMALNAIDQSVGFEDMTSALSYRP